MAPSESEPPPLPGDVLVEIWSRVGDAATVVRCAATCKPWRRLIKDPSFLARLRQRDHDEGFVPSLLLGFFFQGKPTKLPRHGHRRLRPTRFLPMTPSPAPSNVLSLSSFFPDPGLDFSKPVASGAGGLLALRRATANFRGAVEVCVCNPLARTAFPLPPLTHLFPHCFVFLDAGDSSFGLLAVQKLSDRLKLRVFCSRTGEWGPAVAGDVPERSVVLSSPAAVCRGAVHWLCSGFLTYRYAIVAVRISTGQVSRINLPSLLSGQIACAQKSVCLAKSAQGRLCLLAVGFRRLSIWIYDVDGIGEDNGGDGHKNWKHEETIELWTKLPPTDVEFICRKSNGFMIERFCEKSGAVLLRVEGGGLYVLNLKTKVMDKVSETYYANYFCQYEIDWSSCLSAMRAF